MSVACRVRLGVIVLVAACCAAVFSTAAVAAPLGTITELSITPGSAPRGITVGPDGNLWVADARIGMITPSGDVTQFSVGITPGGTPDAISAGPDGNLWFTEAAGSRIGRITPGGLVTEFPVPSGVPASGITAGPDGNVWFTEMAASKIGQITPSGAVTEFGVTPGSGPNGITAGPDGNLWFTEYGGNQIGRITPSGVVTEFSAGITPSASPNAITAGPDGNLWFTEMGAGKVGQITPSGVVTEFSAGITASSWPYGITAGPDGNLWFTEANGNRIGRITPTGVVTEFSAGITPSAFPYGITGGPDGNLWFTEFNRDRIGQISLGASAVALESAVQAFGAVTAGSVSATATVAVENTGDGSLHLSDVVLTGADAGEFVLAVGTTCTAGSTVAVGASCTVAVQYSPTRVGAAAAAVELSDDADDTPQRIELSGIGIAAPTVATGAATAIGRGSATLNGLVTPNGSATHYRFQYGTTTAYGAVTPEQDAGDGVAAVAASTALGGLRPGKTYHVRLVATNASGTTFGTDETFTTVADDVQDTGPSGSHAPGRLVIVRQPAAASASRTAVVAFTGSGARFECRLDRGPWVPCASPFTLSGLHSGDHRVAARALAADGTAGPVMTTQVFQVNVYPPGLALRGLATVAAGRGGRVALRVLCSPREGAGHGACRGTVELRTLPGRQQTRSALLGRARFRARAGHTATLTITLTRAGRRRLAAAPLRRLSVAVVITARDLAGNHTTRTICRTLVR